MFSCFQDSWDDFKSTKLFAGGFTMGAFGGVLQYLEFHPAIAGVGMNWGLMLAEMRSGFRCPISHFGWDEDEGGPHPGDY